jgi:virginiamycin A acetyltransferase
MNAILALARGAVRPISLFAYWRIMNYFHDHKVEAWNVGAQTKVGRRVIIRKGVEVGNHVSIGDFSYISGPRSYIESATIGKFCSIARQTVIGVGNHDHKLVTTHPFIVSPEFGGIIERRVHSDQKPAPIIGNDVWIGLNSIVMRGVTVGDGAVIAANSVVTRDVLPYTIVGGVPARYLKDRFPTDVCSKLQQIRWWDWTEPDLRSRAACFADVESFISEFG